MRTKTSLLCLRGAFFCPAPTWNQNFGFYLFTAKTKKIIGNDRIPIFIWPNWLKKWRANYWQKLLVDLSLHGPY